jgi:hypothetical protein
VLGRFRIEAHYYAALFAAFAFHRTTDVPIAQSRARRAIVVAALVLLSLFVFALQQRRLMVAAALVALFIGPGIPTDRSTIRRWSTPLLVAAALAAGVVLSASGREVDARTSALDRLLLSAQHATDAPLVDPTTFGSASPIYGSTAWRSSAAIASIYPSSTRFAPRSR